MVAERSVAQRVGKMLERLTRQSGRLSETPEFGSWMLGRVTEDQPRRRVRIQVIITVFGLIANLNGIGVAFLLVTVAFPVPSIFTDAPWWFTWVVSPAYVVIALLVGVFWVTQHTLNSLRWAIEERPPTREDQRNTFLAPWRMAKIHLILWGFGTVFLAALYGTADSKFIPRYLFSVGFCGIVVSTSCYLFTEFALRPAAAQALEAGRPPKRFAAGVMGRIMIVWMLSSGVPLLGIILVGVFSLAMADLTETQLAVAVLILGVISLVFGCNLMLIAAWLTATPVRVVRAALHRVERGDLDGSLVVFDGTELGELQRGFNSMVHGLRERERVRDLFGRHVGREVAAAAEQQQVELGGEERDAAMFFVDIVGSTTLAANRPPMEVVDLLNRFFAVIVDEVDRNRGFINKFEGDASLAVFGVPLHLPQAEDCALAAARAIARRLAAEVPECQAGLGVASGRVVAGNIGAKERFEYTVIGDPVNAAARVCDLAKSAPYRVLATWDTVEAASAEERSHWRPGDEVVLRGRGRPTLLATLADP